MRAHGARERQWEWSFVDNQFAIGLFENILFDCRCHRGVQWEECTVQHMACKQQFCEFRTVRGDTRDDIGWLDIVLIPKVRGTVQDTVIHLRVCDAVPIVDDGQSMGHSVRALNEITQYGIGNLGVVAASREMTAMDST